MKTHKSFIRKSIVVLITGIIVIALTNCTGKNSESADASGAKINKEELEKTVRDVVYPLPTSFEVINMINKIEASYVIGISNPVANVDKYFTNKDQALNLGVYSADLSYAATYNMKQDVMNFMDVSQELVVQLDITNAFNKDFVDKIETNIDNKDSLTSLISNSFYDTYTYLVKNNKEDLSLLVLAGSWVEAMYISCNITETVYNNPDIVKVILHQKNSLEKLINLLIPHNNHETIKSILNDLKPIKDVYDSIDQNGITQAQLEQIVKQTEELRKRITS
ncbi:MAG: hypothetical protein A2041_07715 [Bacteroidetes bacterium GWA2_31_9b]|nr:MAG: hypothetical protein A2041_07715 [Bacteroidetes bacterium GWA2_31_9b]